MPNERSLRPRVLADFVGQQQAVAALALATKASRARGEAMDHLLLIGPPGLGKTTLARIVAHELKVRFLSSSGPALRQEADVVALLTCARPRGVVFIDEIHGLTRTVEETLYPALEDFQLQCSTGQCQSYANATALAPFTLIGATTRPDLISRPLRDRFGLIVRLDLYQEGELEQIVARAAGMFGLDVTPAAVHEIARRARATPRIAGRLLRRVRDYAAVNKLSPIDRIHVDQALSALGIDSAGLDDMDRRYLATLALYPQGGPVGLNALAATLSEPRDAIEEIIEPYLLHAGFISRTPRGRQLLQPGYDHLGIAPAGETAAPEADASGKTLVPRPPVHASSAAVGDRTDAHGSASLRHGWPRDGFAATNHDGED